MQHSLYSRPQIIDNYDNTYTMDVPSYTLTPEITDSNVYYNYDNKSNDLPAGIYQSKDSHITFLPSFLPTNIDDSEVLNEQNNSCYHNIINFCWTF